MSKAAIPSVEYWDDGTYASGADLRIKLGEVY